MSKKLFDNKTDYAVLGFIVAVSLMLGFCEDASAGAFSVEEWHDSNAGTTEFNQGLDRICGRYTYDGGSSLMLCPIMAVGGHIENDSWEFGFAERFGRWEGQLQLNRFAGEMDGGFSVRRIFGDGPFNLALGGSYWINESPGSDSNVTFNLGMRYTF